MNNLLEDRDLSVEGMVAVVMEIGNNLTKGKILLLEEEIKSEIGAPAWGVARKAETCEGADLYLDKYCINNACESCPHTHQILRNEDLEGELID